MDFSISQYWSTYITVIAVTQLSQLLHSYHSYYYTVITTIYHGYVFQQIIGLFQVAEFVYGIVNMCKEQENSYNSTLLSQ